MIHKYEMNGLYIVLDVHSGGVHIVDELTYRMLDDAVPPFADECPAEIVEKLKNDFEMQDILDCYAELKELAEQNILFANDEYEKYARFAAPAPIKAMCLHISHDCNMRCQYCFASTGDFGTGRKLMPAETGKLAIDFLLERSKDRKFLELDFFGGEPLMNFNAVKEVVRYARERRKGIRKEIPLYHDDQRIIIKR